MKSYIEFILEEVESNWGKKKIKSFKQFKRKKKVVEKPLENISGPIVVRNPDVRPPEVLTGRMQTGER